MTEYLDEEFINKYKDIKPQFGFNGLGYIVYKRCVEKNTPVLCDDLKWRKAGELKYGDGIIGFDAEPITVYRGRKRYLRHGKVMHNSIEKAKTVGIELENGEVIYCTPDHSWLVKFKDNSTMFWRQAKDLVSTKYGNDVYLVAPFGKVWNTENDYESGYISASFDGEGNLDRIDGLSFVQADNAMMKKMKHCLSKKNEHYTERLKSNNTKYEYKSIRKLTYALRFFGRKKLFRLLGKYRPERLINNFKENFKKMSNNKNSRQLRCKNESFVKVKNVFDGGERDIAVLSTDIGTHFTGGYASHNTYARPLKDKGRKEEWYETVARCVNGMQEISGAYSKQELEELYDKIFNMKVLPPGRGMWQLGTDTVREVGANSLVNCLAGETNVLTRQGWKQIKDLQDKEVDVVTSGGKWVKAPFYNYGKQKLYNIKFSDGSIIRASPTHRWFVRDKKSGGYKEIWTKNLKPNTCVPIVRGKNSIKSLSPQGIQHGLIYGDGTCDGYDSKIDLFGNTKKYCEKYFSELNKSNNLNDSDGVRYVDMPNYYKELPNINENKKYLAGFLAGWIAADGSVNTSNNSVRLFNKDKNVLEKARNLAIVLGVRTGEPVLERVKNPFNGTPSELWSIRFYNSDNLDKFLIRGDHKKKYKSFDKQYNNTLKILSVEETNHVEDVYCAEVPETHSFVINSCVLTGNCWFVPVRNIDAFTFVLDNMMLGGGCGFSVKKEDVYELPRIKKGVEITHKRTNDADFIVPDSREGWVKAFKEMLKSFFYTGKSYTYSTVLVRPYGTPIKKFGGTASGPEPLIRGIRDAAKILKKREGKKIRPIDALDIMNIIGSIVVAGNVRRSAEIAIGDADDNVYLRSKRWDLGNIPNWRAMSNNSVDVSSYDELTSTFWKGYEGNGEPFGIINTNNMRKYGRLGEHKPDPDVEGTNPCGEISLPPYSPCNLGELILPKIESKDELWRCTKLMYKYQKAVCNMHYINAKTRKIVYKEQRIGMSVTGIADAMDKVDWLDDNYKKLEKFDKDYSKKNGYNESIKLTTVKPSGTVSLLPGVTPGVHPAYSEYYIRRVRLSSHDELVQLAKDAGFNVEYVENFDGSKNTDTVVVEFPCKAGKNSVLAKDVGAVRQLEMAKMLNEKWVDQQTSVTVYYKKEELPEIQEWLKNNLKDNVKAVSFLLHMEHGFKQAPYEEIDEKTYYKMVSKLDFSKLNISSDALIEDVGCSGGGCPVR